jgi:uncharacterized protein (TIGR03437 family)
VTLPTALLNDGSAVGKVTIGPYDGILLRRNTPIAGSVAGVSGVINAASFQPAIAAGGFVSIKGFGFGTDTRGWSPSDFAGSSLPTALSGVSVSINDKPAFVEYTSPTQVNVIAPDDDTIGPVKVRVQMADGGSYSGTVLKQRLSPAFFTYPQGSKTYAAALHLDGSLVGPVGPYSRPAVPGEIIEIYGTGFGTTSPSTDSSQLVSQAAALAVPATVTIGGVNAEVQWAGIVSSGLYQLNVKVPAIPSGDQPAATSISGFEGASGVFLTIGAN